MATLNGHNLNGGFGGALHTKRNPANAAGAVRPAMTTRQVRRMKARLEKQKPSSSASKGFG